MRLRSQNDLHNAKSIVGTQKFRNTADKVRYYNMNWAVRASTVKWLFWQVACLLAHFCGSGSTAFTRNLFCEPLPPQDY